MIASLDDRRLLRGVLEEAIESQSRIRLALEEQLKESEVTVPSIAPSDPSDERAWRAHAKAIRRAEQVPIRIAEVEAAEQRLSEMQKRLRDSDTADNLGHIRREMEGLGLGKRLETFDIDTRSMAQWGRPEGFDGVVIESPRGIPILIAYERFSDGLLRRISRGTDLWFQVSDLRGSRVLLRTSMVRRFSKSPRECMEAAADFAAYFSESRYSEEQVDVMYTDSRNVGKRGGRIGQLKVSKKLGMIRAMPWRAAKQGREAAEYQGFAELVGKLR
jgi:predicted ribosome quality control (RQC) complex YloA/Tae2 family protein